MKHERRRYFRINETLGIAYQVIETAADDGGADASPAKTLLDQLAAQDKRIEVLLAEVALTDPQVAELVRILNYKLDQILAQQMTDNRTVERIAQRVKEANISACGIAFNNEEYLPVGSSLRLELSLFPGEIKLNVKGRLVGCDPSSDQVGYYWRIDFYGMTEQTQEQLIQHIVKRQSAQLKQRRPG